MSRSHLKPSPFPSYIWVVCWYFCSSLPYISNTPLLDDIHFLISTSSHISFFQLPMASSYKDNNEGPDPMLKPSTTFVQADPSNFRAIVQKLTGRPTCTIFQQPIYSISSGQSNKQPTHSKVSGHKSGHKLYERRKSVKKLEITLNKELVARPAVVRETVMVSPVSTLDVCGRQTPRMLEEEDIAIADKGFYLHPSPIKGSKPELLVLFPLNSIT